MLPLGGTRIIDLSAAIAGPVATRVLAHLGAEVIKVEAPWGRAAEGTGRRPYNAIPSFNEANRGKKGLSLNLQEPEGKEVFLRLVGVSDAVVENFSPRVLRNLGLTYDVLRRARPDIILVSIPALGAEGPWADFIAFGPGAEALGGLCALTGYEGGPPLKAHLFYADQNAAFHAAVALLAALYRRRRTGQGGHIVVPLRECVQAVIGEAFLEAQMRGFQSPPRRGSRHPSWAPHNVYRCRGEDAWAAIACATDEEFQRLCQVMGRPGLAEDPRFADSLSRKRNEAALDGLVEEWTRERTPQEAMALLQAAGVKAGAVLTAADLFKHDPHWQTRAYWDRAVHPEAGEGVHPGLPWKALRMERITGGPAPLFAQENAWLQRELLGLPEDMHPPFFFFLGCGARWGGGH